MLACDMVLVCYYLFSSGSVCVAFTSVFKICLSRISISWRSATSRFKRESKVSSFFFQAISSFYIFS